MLARLSSDTGGRFTRSTNDMSLPYARAQRDLSCRYSIGFYLTDTEEDVPTRITVGVRRPGLRALHPSKYAFRSESFERESTILAAFAAPEMFAAPFLRAHLFKLQPRSPGQWDTLLAISFPVHFENLASEVKIDFGAVLLRDSLEAYSFDRRVTLRPRVETPSKERRFLFLEPIPLDPGLIELRVVMADADGTTRPGALKIKLKVPPIERREITLVKPILGSPRDKNIVVRGDDSFAGRAALSSDKQAKHDINVAKGGFEPMLVQRIEETLDLAARNKVCRVGREGKTEGGGFERSLIGDEGHYELQEVPLELERQGKVWCQNVFEILPDGIEPGDYNYETSVEVHDELAEESLPLGIDEAQTRPSVTPQEGDD